METFILRPSVDAEYRRELLAKLFEEKILVDKTVVGDRIVYVFKDN